MTTNSNRFTRGQDVNWALIHEAGALIIEYETGVVMESLESWEVDTYKATIEAAYVMLYLRRDKWDLPESLMPCTFPWDEFVKLNPSARELSRKFQEIYGETSEHQMSTAVAALWSWKHGRGVRFGGGAEAEGKQ